MAEKGEKSEAAKREEEVLAFWERERVFEKSLEKDAPKGDFVFFEGPPTANGMPGIHHLEARAFKDALPRYKTMRGYRVERRAGWDTHGLPVELQVEKELGFSGKPDIEKYGIAAFNKKCRESVFMYIDHWAKFTKRIGYWVDASKAYFTFDSAYMEVVWHLFAKSAAEGRLYKDYRIVPWCPRCGTSLSSHELAQGYEDVKDLTITAKFELVDEPGTFVLAWTTTPWTLPGNVALAVGADIEYGVYNIGEERVILATALAARLLAATEGAATPEALSTMKGSALVGKHYKPLYDYAKELAAESEKAKFAAAFQIYAASFVTIEDGTGIVHIAPMYGQDDFELGNAMGLPKVHLVNAEGKFIPGTSFLAGSTAGAEDTAVAVLKNLQTRELVFKKDSYAHSYPFCWRCKTRLIYYARDSWYLRMQDLRDTLVAENKRVGWTPEYIRDGRMGEWLTNAKDWSVSRERYWGTPMPVWESEDGNGRLVIGSVEELKSRIKKSGNTYFLMRHGEAEGNAKQYIDSDGEATNTLTEQGIAQVQAAIEDLKKKGVTKIYASPLLRTRQTAELVAEGLGIAQESIVFDDRLRELNFGDFSGEGKQGSYAAFWEWKKAHTYADTIPGGESYLDAKNRLASFVYELEATVAKERILIVSHGVAFESFEVLMQGADVVAANAILDQVISRAKNAEVREYPFVPLPHNDKYELDLHRPYIDDVVLLSEKGTELRRVKEVMDVWFDSGAMPFAQAAKGRGEESLDAYLEKVAYPADYISEAIDQTRGWFYTLLAVGVLAGRGAAYRNVICLGHLLDAEGKKMSKSKGNVVDPVLEIERWGADAVRFWMYSVTQPGDSKNYDEKTVKEAAKVLSWLDNSTKFYELFKEVPLQAGEETVLDIWMRARTEAAVAEVTTALDAYKVFEATRAISALAEDLSQWYVRRVRDRARTGDAAALTTLRETLCTCALLIAPFAPFLAEDMYQKLRGEGDPLSVHLAAWPAAPKRFHLAALLGITPKAETLQEQMILVRTLASQALQLRQKAGIKVRQPLASVAVPHALAPELAAILADEINVKAVLTGEALALDTVLTPELIAEGKQRELDRAIAEARKTLGLSPQDKYHHELAPDGQFSVELPEGTARFNLVPDAA